MEKRDSVLDALARSVDALDDDPAIVPTQEFRRRGRIALMEVMQPSRTYVRASVPRRLAAMGVATLLFGMVAMPALADRSTIVEGVTGFANEVTSYAFGLERGDEVDEGSEDALLATAPGEIIAGLAGEMVTDVQSEVDADLPVDATGNLEIETISAENVQAEADASDLDSHGVTVAGVAQGELTGGTTRGEMVRQAARNNHGQSVAVTVRGELLESNSHGEMVSAAARQNQSQDAPETAQDAHGAAVSEVAQNNTGDGTHGETVSAAATDNHGQAVSEQAQGGGQPADTQSGATDGAPPIDVPAVAEEAADAAPPVEVPAGPPAAPGNGAAQENGGRGR